jgi:predicted phosphodiesterase
VRPDLALASRIAFVGDTHSNLRWLLHVAALMKGNGVAVLVVLGDFGLTWTRPEPDNFGVDELSAHLIGAGQTLYFVDGNHECHPHLLALPLDDDGLRPIAPGIFHIPRGYRTTLAHGRTLAALGGANSIDVDRRTPGWSWFPEESITEEDLERLGPEHADILIGHDAPLDVPRLDAYLQRSDRYWSTDALAYSAKGQAMFDRGFKQVRPSIFFGGHYHVAIDEEVSFQSPDGPFECRVIIRDCDGTREDANVAILDLATLEVEFPSQDFRADDTADDE